MRRKPHDIFSAVIGITIVAVFVVWLAAQVRIADQVARSMTCGGNLSTLSLALYAYHEKYGSLPPAYVADEKGEPIHSWRVLILEFLDKPLYEAYSFDEPWNGPNNKKLADRALQQYFCPSDSDARRQLETNYLVVVGPGTAFPGAEVTSFENATAALARTIFLVEVADSGIHWMEPRDLALDEFLNPHPASPRLSSYHIPGPHVVTMDATNMIIDDEFDRDRLKWMVTISGEDDP